MYSSLRCCDRLQALAQWARQIQQSSGSHWRLGKSTCTYMLVWAHVLLLRGASDVCCISLWLHCCRHCLTVLMLIASYWQHCSSMGPQSLLRASGKCVKRVSWLSNLPLSPSGSCLSMFGCTSEKDSARHKTCMPPIVQSSFDALATTQQASESTDTKRPEQRCIV